MFLNNIGIRLVIFIYKNDIHNAIKVEYIYWYAWLMKKLFLFLVALCACVSINAQISVVDFMGTWRGEKGDTTFTIKLVQGETFR